MKSIIRHESEKRKMRWDTKGKTTNAITVIKTTFTLQADEHVFFEKEVEKKNFRICQEEQELLGSDETRQIHGCHLLSSSQSDTKL